MLEAARLALCEVGVLGAGERMPPYSLRMSGNLVFLAYFDPTRFYAIKVGAQSDLRREYEGLREGHRLLPEGVPKPLALSRHRGFPTLVTEGLTYRPLGPVSLERRDAMLADQIARFFVACRRAFATRPAQPASERLRAANDEAGGLLPAADWQRYCERVAAEADALPPVLQHGDFYVHNLGVRENALIVLDWEEFGLESLPGLDVALLLLTLDYFDVRKMWADTREGGRYRWILDAGCDGSGVPQATLFRLLPGYLALAARNKHVLGYGDTFATAVRRALPDALAVAADVPYAAAGSR